MYLSTIISAVMQVLVFTLIPLVVYVATRRRVRGFWAYIGFKRAPGRMVGTSATVGVGISLIMLWILSAPELRQLMFDPSTQTGRLSALGDESGVVALLVVALIQAIVATALAEEILFRGFIAKRLIAWRGFLLGNILQAVLFGAVHWVLFVGADTPLTLARWFFVFLIPTLQGWLIGWLNEKHANGSIVPGWTMHAVGNALTFIVIPIWW